VIIHRLRCLVTLRAKSISLVTLPQKASGATVVRGYKEGTPAMRLFLAIILGIP